MLEEIEEKRWLVQQIKDLIRDFRDDWESERESFASDVETVEEALNRWRNSGLAIIAFLITFLFPFASLENLSPQTANYALIVFAVIGLAIFLGVNQLRDSLLRGIDEINKAYLVGLFALQYIGGSFYTRSFNTSGINLNSIYIFNDFVRVASGALYSEVLARVRASVGLIVPNPAKQEFLQTIDKVDQYVERAYGVYKERRNDFVRPGEFSGDLLSMLAVFERRLQKEMAIDNAPATPG